MKNEKRTIVIDVDGVLVHSVFYSEDGERFKSFNARDNRAIREMVAAGWRVILMSKSRWTGIHRFAERVGCDSRSSVEDKLSAVRALGIDHFYAVADDIDDAPLLSAAARSWYPRGSLVQPISCNCHYISAAAGEGVVAEVWRDIQISEKQAH
jgi:3-deoxy-D-manno-octulosonate 8-phosphate phosphatase KdsC-like HAD superfamily phosphatase